jgi:hypothetical protein
LLLLLLLVANALCTASSFLLLLLLLLLLLRLVAIATCTAECASTAPCAYHPWAPHTHTRLRAPCNRVTICMLTHKGCKMSFLLLDHPVTWHTHKQSKFTVIQFTI